MKRDVFSSFFAWEEKTGRKPLVLMGARQVGKTWLMREFGKRNFARVHEFNFDGSTFGEYLREKDASLYEYWAGIAGSEPLDEIFHHRLLDAYDEYLIVGGSGISDFKVLPS